MPELAKYLGRRWKSDRPDVDSVEEGIAARVTDTKEFSLQVRRSTAKQRVKIRCRATGGVYADTSARIASQQSERPLRTLTKLLLSCPTRARRAQWQPDTPIRAVMFILDAQRLARMGCVESALDLIYDRIDELMRKGDLAQLEAILSHLRVSELSVDILLSILTATLPVRTRLRSRTNLFRKIEQTLRERGEYEEGLLTGLE